MFTVWNLDEKRESTLEMIWQLHKEGKSNNFIRDYLNENNFRPQRVTKYTNKMVWNSLKKYEKRLRNKDVVTIKVESVHLLRRNGGHE
jgi:Ca2+-dependent lipid-binding protein